MQRLSKYIEHNVASVQRWRWFARNLWCMIYMVSDLFITVCTHTCVSKGVCIYKMAGWHFFPPTNIHQCSAGKYCISIRRLNTCISNYVLHVETCILHKYDTWLSIQTNDIVTILGLTSNPSPWKPNLTKCNSWKPEYEPIKSKPNPR